ncbi:hypothetical protein GvMRE_IIg176 [endosymbiont GvMRE of Glomus versiforme]|nr:hypothetical protein GvMRE_IIg176 [endosymbiont GvMRE of Glomus versiforme]
MINLTMLILIDSDVAIVESYEPTTFGRVEETMYYQGRYYHDIDHNFLI